MQVSLTSLQSSSFLLTSVVSEELPIGGQIELSLLINTGNENGSWSQSWVLSVVDRIGQVDVLEQNTTSFTISSVKEEINNGSEQTLTTPESDSSPLTTVGLFLVVLALAALLGTLAFLRVRAKEESKDEGESFDSQNYSETEFTPQTIPVETYETTDAIEPPVLCETPTEPLTPSSDTTATATDEHGYEWYTEENGTNWYRLQGSGSEWYLHQG
jgi:hypothetical protein